MEANFKITVDDQFCKYEYPLNISADYSIQNVMEKIYETFDLPMQKGVWVKEDEVKSIKQLKNKTS